MIKNASFRPLDRPLTPTDPERSVGIREAVEDLYEDTPSKSPLTVKYGHQQQILAKIKEKTLQPDHPWKNLGELGTRLTELGKISGQIQKSNLHPDVYLEYLSHEIAYQDLQKGMILPGSSANTHYEVDRVFKNSDGLIAYGLKSSSPKEKPILLFQGTDPENIAHLHLDTDSDIGKEAILGSQNQLSTWLEENPQAILTGHSLGGTMAQQLAARNPENIKSVVTFCAPGVSQETAALFTKNSPKNLDVRHYITTKDPVPWFGDTPIDGTLITLGGQHSIANAHTANALRDRRPNIDKSNIQKLTASTREAGILERLRQKPFMQEMLHDMIDRPKSPTQKSAGVRRKSDLLAPETGRNVVEMKSLQEVQSSKEIEEQNMIQQIKDELLRSRSTLSPGTTSPSETQAKKNDQG